MTEHNIHLTNGHTFFMPKNITGKELIKNVMKTKNQFTCSLLITTNDLRLIEFIII